MSHALIAEALFSWKHAADGGRGPLVLSILCEAESPYKSIIAPKHSSHLAFWLTFIFFLNQDRNESLRWVYFTNRYPQLGTCVHQQIPLKTSD